MCNPDKQSRGTLALTVCVYDGLTIEINGFSLFFSFLKSGKLTWTENINQLAHLVDLFQVYVIDVIRTDESGSQQRAQYLLAEYESLQLMEESNSIQQQRKAAN